MPAPKAKVQVFDDADLLDDAAGEGEELTVAPAGETPPPEGGAPPAEG